jgi:hypothetical protein
MIEYGGPLAELALRRPTAFLRARLLLGETRKCPNFGLTATDQTIEAIVHLRGEAQS